MCHNRRTIFAGIAATIVFILLSESEGCFKYGGSMSRSMGGHRRPVPPRMVNGGDSRAYMSRRLGRMWPTPAKYPPHMVYPAGQELPRGRGGSAAAAAIAKNSVATDSGSSSKMKVAKVVDKIERINSPGHRFTATHGVSLKKGESKTFVFTVDRSDANYMMISSHVAIRGAKGAPETYDIYMKYGSMPTTKDYDHKTKVTRSEGYDGVLFSRDISLARPEIGDYYLLLVAKETFHELLITAIMDTPPEGNGEADFEIRRIGKAPSK